METLKVEQCDRDAAADYLLEHEGYAKDWHSRGCAEAVRSGRSHRMELAEAFARHRIAERERCAGIAERYRNEAGGSESYRQACRHIAQAIRAASDD